MPIERSSFKSAESDSFISPDDGCRGAASDATAAGRDRALGSWRMASRTVGLQCRRQSRDLEEHDVRIADRREEVLMALVSAGSLHRGAE